MCNLKCPLDVGRLQSVSILKLENTTLYSYIIKNVFKTF